MKLKSMENKLFFIPETNKNRDLPEKEQIVVEYNSRPTAAEIRRLIVKGSGEVAVLAEHQLLKKHIKSIKNLETDEVIDTASKMLDSDNPLILYFLIEIGKDLVHVGSFEEGES